jgi:hypothetical protein
MPSQAITRKRDSDLSIEPSLDGAARVEVCADIPSNSGHSVAAWLMAVNRTARVARGISSSGCPGASRDNVPASGAGAWRGCLASRGGHAAETRRSQFDPTAGRPVWQPAGHGGRPIGMVAEKRPNRQDVGRPPQEAGEVVAVRPPMANVSPPRRLPSTCAPSRKQIAPAGGGPGSRLASQAGKRTTNAPPA